MRIQVRTSGSPQAAPRTKKASKTKTTAKSRQALPLSTNVSSPASRARGTRPRINDDDEDNDYDYDDEDTNINLPRRRAASRSKGTGYIRDDFVVSDPADEDYSDDSDGFERVRDAGRPLRRAQQGFGDPITIDERIAGLSEIEREVLESFVEEARKECKKIMMNKGLRAVPFTDTMLREMGIRLPSTQEEMRSIPGIDPLKVDNFSKPFLALTARWRQSRKDMMLGAQNPIKPFDPNHQIVDLVSDDAEDDFGAEDLSDQEQTSSYFAGNKAAADFNMQMDQAQGQRRAAEALATTKKRPAADDFRAGGSRKRNSGGVRAFKEKYAYKDNKKSEGGRSRATSGGGAAKRKTSSVYAANTGRAKSKANSTGMAGGQEGQRTMPFGGIGMMPT